MVKEKCDPPGPSRLRCLAEERLNSENSAAGYSLPHDESQRLIHELQVHQLELEMQNTELRQTREQLENALEKYADLYDFAPVGYFTLDRSGAISTANLAGASLVGIVRSLLIGKRFRLFVTDETRPAFNAFLEKVFAGSDKVTCEVDLLKEGNYPLFVQIEAAASASGQECRIAIIDITELKIAMEALRKVERAAEVARLMVEEATETALLVVEEATEEHQTEKKALELARQKMEKATEEARLIAEENLVIPQKAKEIAAAEIARLKVEKAAEVARQMLKTAAEVAHRKVEERTAERKRVSTALHECEWRFQLLIDGIKDYAIFILNVDGCVASWNEGARRLKGWNEQEVLGRHLSMFYPEDAVASGHPEYEIKIAATQGRFAEECWRVRKDGSKFMADVIITAIHDEYGQLCGFSKVTRDITERLQAEALQQAKDLAEAATEAKSQFLANMSHELRTPMTGVLGMLDLVLLGNLEAKQREYIETAHTSARSLVRILNDILDLTKIEAGKFSIIEKPFSVRDCVDNTCNVLFPAVKTKGIDLVCTVADDVPETLIGDQIRINQVLTNLVGNSVKFTQKGKIELRVTIGGSTHDSKREVTFTVIDCGVGIPNEKKHLLFQAFSQADDTHSRSYGGTGLGLVICKGIVERMGGAITFTTEEGVGSTFSFTLPLAETSQECEAQFATKPYSTETTSTASAGASNPYILLAEDDPTIRQVLGAMFKLSNYHVDFAEDGKKAIEMWEQGGHDLMLMDIQMPRLNGYEATSIIRDKEQSRGGHTPIVAMTAHAGKEVEEMCLAAGMDAYISKPIDFMETLLVIGETLKTVKDSRMKVLARI